MLGTVGAKWFMLWEALPFLASLPLALFFPIYNFLLNHVRVIFRHHDTSPNTSACYLSRTNTFLCITTEQPADSGNLALITILLLCSIESIFIYHQLSQQYPSQLNCRLYSDFTNFSINAFFLFLRYNPNYILHLINMSL